MNFVQALQIAQSVLEQYKIDQPKWWKQMDGTPILNDVAVRMAKAFLQAEPEQPNFKTLCARAADALDGEYRLPGRVAGLVIELREAAK